MQNIGEGTLAIPADWHNQTVNVFTAQSPGAAGMSITVNRDTLALGVEFDEYVKAQSAKVGSQLKGFKALGRESFELDGRPAVELEFTWQADDVGTVHQILVTVNDGRKVMNMAASLGGRMTSSQATIARQALHSLRFSAEDPAPAAAPG